MSMEAALANALKRQEELKRELAEIDQFIALYHRFSGGKTHHLHVSEALGVVDKSAQLVLDSFQKRRGRPSDFGRIMEGILKDFGRPMQRGELAAEVEKRGYSIPSEDKPRYLGTILWRQRDNRFVNIPDCGYWLKNVPCEPIGYMPGDVVDARIGDSEETATGVLKDTKSWMR